MIDWKIVTRPSRVVGGWLCLQAMILLPSQRGLALEATQALLTYFDGEVSYRQAGSSGELLPVRVNLQLSEGDEIVTGQNGRVELVLNNRSVLRVDGNSHLRILSLGKGEDTDGRQGAAFELLVGSLWTRIKKFLERPPQTDIHFPTSIAGVQGTAYRAVVAADSATNVRVYEGSVEMRQRPQGSGSVSGPPKKVEGPREVPGPQKVTLEAWIKLVKANQEISISKVGKPAEPQPFRDQGAAVDWVKWNQERDKKLEW